MVFTHCLTGVFTYAIIFVVMSEIPKGSQLVGSADARTMKTSEAPKKTEVTPTPEQQQVVDTMKNSGEVLENNVLDAREKAAGQLKQLHGKELVDAGLKQMGHGVWETFKSELKWGISGAIVGSVAGAAGGYAIGRREEDGDVGIILGMMGGSLGGNYGRKAGQMVGFETAGLHYNKKIATKQNLPTTKWYDWVVSNAGVIGTWRILKGKHIGAKGRAAESAFDMVFNPITVGGLRNVATGLWQMKKG